MPLIQPSNKQAIKQVSKPAIQQASNQTSQPGSHPTSKQANKKASQPSNKQVSKQESKPAIQQASRPASQPGRLKERVWGGGSPPRKDQMGGGHGGVPTTLDIWRSPGPTCPRTKYPVRGIPHFDFVYD